MARLTPENVRRAKDLIGLYPEPRSALIPMLHVAQEQDGWLTPEAMEHVGALLDLTPAEVYGTATFYDMLFTEPVGRHLVSICTNLACLLNGADDLLQHAEESLGIPVGGTTADGEFTLEEVECIAFCGGAPCLAVNWRFFGSVSTDVFDQLVDDLRSRRLADEVPPHGTLCRVRRSVGLTAADPPAVPPGPPPPPAPPPPQASTGPAPPKEAAPPAPEPPAEVRGAGEVQPADRQATAESAEQARTIEESGEARPRDGS